MRRERRPLTDRAANAFRLGAFALAAWAAAPTLAFAERPPNIVVMLVDNLGYGDIGAYGGGEVRNAPTPRIDRLAAEGLRLTNFNVEPECTPSRSALLTGRMPIRSGTSKVPLPGLPQGITPWEYTLAELLHDAGYQSALYGKWHLGDKLGRMPNDQGFDEWWGFAHSSGETLNNIQPGWSADLAPTQKIEQGKRGEPSTTVGDYDYAMRPLMDEKITQKSVAYIRAHAADPEPFFLFVSFSLPHAPPLPNPKFRDPGRTDYQNVLTEIDHNTGEILDALESMGVAKNTIVVWLSDNGPETHQGPYIQYGAAGDSGPFRGEFPSAWEGAIRVPCIVRWPGRVQPGRSSNEIVSILDLYRTLAGMAGAAGRVPSDRPIDSIDQSAFLLGKQPKSNREHVMFFHGADLLAIKWRNFKVHMSVRETAHGDVRMPGQGVITGYATPLSMPWVFDVANDPKELWNIAPSSTWVGAQVAKAGVAYQKSLEKFPNIPAGAAGPQGYD
jgi:arylsulfatase A-like enzyme